MESESPYTGESQHGQVPFHRTRQGKMPPGTNPGQVVSCDVSR
jgi:hypothetical protein